MPTPEKRKYFALKESMQSIDCEVLVHFQGFPDTWDEDGDLDDDQISVGTESCTASVRDLIALVSQEEVTGRKLGGKQLRLWLPRGNIINFIGYRWKDSITRKLRVNQISGYEEKQIVAYVTADGYEPQLQAAQADSPELEREAEEAEGVTEEETQEQPQGQAGEEAEGEDFHSLPTSPAKDQKSPGQSAADSQASKKRKTSAGTEERMELDDEEEEEESKEEEEEQSGPGQETTEKMMEHLQT